MLRQRPSPLRIDGIVKKDSLEVLHRDEEGRKVAQARGGFGGRQV